MKEISFTILENKLIAEGTYRLRMTGDASAMTAPGQFVDLRVENGFLRRPISVSDWDGLGVTLIYRAVGRGTRWLAAQNAGKTLDALTGLGSGFDLREAGDAPLLVGGGVGAAPLYGLARRLREGGAAVIEALGFRTGAEVFCEDDFRALGCRVSVATEDGSHGVKGFVTGALPEAYSYVYACGPTPMLRALYRTVNTPAQFSMEERMGCGFGACMGCTIDTAAGAKRVCKDGPVFRKEELLWQTQA